MIFLKGEAVPQWLATGPDVKFGCDAVVEEHEGGYRISPRTALTGDESLITAKDVPQFPKRVLLWNVPWPNGAEQP